ncbi:MAG: hypothetical protein Hyperionvirus29_22 [Hyperionvirus sp.]|uniref:Uncharacterized protein n=1 Tax=Hyperionvirus sp. TaxID=2487770 RepID=A0A3G5AGP5_9VIRU|nr:MAG: hypothetical protein Hyperionvirus29_22 [Hyperionvirus sp.]
MIGRGVRIYLEEYIETLTDDGVGSIQVITIWFMHCLQPYDLDDMREMVIK